MNCFGIGSVLCDMYLTRFDLTKDLLFDTFFIADFFNKQCRCDYCIFIYIPIIFNTNESVN